MNMLLEEARQIPILQDVDLCVVGGSCTGVFAAVRAARLGLKVVIIEKQNCFGGVATSGLVNVWHSLHNEGYNKQIIAGLTYEMIERFKLRNAIYIKDGDHSSPYTFNSEELKIELDKLIMDEKIIPYLHTQYCTLMKEDHKIKTVVIENKSGRGAIKANMFIDATGDGDLYRHLGLVEPIGEELQPPTACSKIYGLNLLKDFQLRDAIEKHAEEFDIPKDWGWSAKIPTLNEITMNAENHILNVNCADADMLTHSEIEGRRIIRGIMDLIRKYADGGDKIALVSLCSYIGIRETYHISADYRIKNDDILYGKDFSDAIGYGSYRTDVHHSDGTGLTFRYLDGTETRIYNTKTEHGRWRPETSENPTYYQISYSSLINSEVDNLICCGRSIAAEKIAFSALRVMVNTNQMGEAAGTAAYLALSGNSSMKNVDINKLKETLKKGGSIIF